jgi:hypothetical protein
VFLFTAGAGDNFLLRNMQTGRLGLLFNEWQEKFPPGHRSSNLNLTTHVYLVLNLKIRCTLTPLRHMTPSMAHDNLIFLNIQPTAFYPLIFYYISIWSHTMFSLFYCSYFSTLQVYIFKFVRGHSAIVLMVTINGMQEMHPVICLLLLIL